MIIICTEAGLCSTDWNTSDFNFDTNKHPCAQSYGGSEHPEKVDEDAIPRRYKIGPEVNLLQKEL